MFNGVCGEGVLDFVVYVAISVYGHHWNRTVCDTDCKMETKLPPESLKTLSNRIMISLCGSPDRFRESNSRK